MFLSPRQEFRSINYSKIGFGRALTTKEKEDYVSTVKQAKEKLGATGKSILIVHDVCLPQAPHNNTGVGNISSPQATGFFDLMKNYLDISHIEVLPQGEVSSDGKGFHCAYSGTALSLGTHQINLELLTKPEFGQILMDEDVKKVVDANKEKSITDKSGERTILANYENVVSPDSEHNLALRKAFVNFEKLPEDNSLKTKFELYKKENNEILEPKALYAILAKEHGSHDWARWHDETDENLYSPNRNEAKSSGRIQELKEKHSGEIDFFKFRQFMADEHHSYGRQKLNKNGLRLIGDCLIGFTKDEEWVHQGAFIKGSTIGWSFPAFDDKKIHNPDGSLGDTGKYLKKKFEFFFKRYDSVRFDVGRLYSNNVYELHSNSKSVDLGDGVLKFIEKTAETIKTAKGEKYNQKDLMYEGDGGGFFHTNYQGESGVVKPFEGRVLVKSTGEMNQNWDSVDFLLNKAKISADDFVIGTGNHDTLPLRQLAEGKGHAGQKESQLEPLSRFLKIPAEGLKEPKEFAKAKFAELFTGAKNHMFFYMDVMGKKERFNKIVNNTSENFRYKLSDNYEADYHAKLQEGHGFNLMDAMEKAFKAKGLDEKHPALYKTIKKYSGILAEKGVLTEAEANKTIKNVPKSKASKILLAITAGGSALAGAVYYFASKGKIHADSRMSDFSADSNSKPAASRNDLQPQTAEPADFRSMFKDLDKLALKYKQ